MTTPIAENAEPAMSDSAEKRNYGRLFWLAGLVFVGIWVIFNIVVLLWVVLNSFRGGQAIFSRPFELPRSFDFVNYHSAWVLSALNSGFANSVVLVFAGTALTLVLASMAAYVLSRVPRRSANPLIMFFALGLGIPLQAVIIPLWVFMNSISNFGYTVFAWWDERLSLLLVYIATSLPFAVFLLTGFFRTLPSEVEDAAAIDGASASKVFLKIMLPMAKSGISTAFVLTGIGLWNETLLALVFITDNAKQTLPQSLLSLYGTMQMTADWGGLFAGIMIVVLPTIVAFFILGRKLTDGMALGIGK